MTRRLPVAAALASAAVAGLAAIGSDAPKSSGRIALLTQMLAAVNAGDAARYASLYAPDAVAVIYGVGELEGRDAVHRHEVELLRQYPGARLSFDSVWQKGDLAVVRYAVNARTTGEQPMGHEGLLFFRFGPSGLIREERRYMDSLTAMAQLGVLGDLPARPEPTPPTAMKAHAAEDSPDEEANVTTVRSSFAALDSRNEAGFLATLAEDVALDELVLPRPFVGRQNAKAWLDTWTGAAPDATTEITTILGVGDSVLLETVVRGTLKGSFAHVAGANRPFTIHRAAIVQVRLGKVVRLSAFMNGKELAQAVGQWPLRTGR